MESNLLQRHFEKIGARVRLGTNERPRWGGSGGLVTFDVQHDAKGEFFSIRAIERARASIEVLDVQPRDRHLLVLVRENSEKHKFLCGHDERHWFVAAIPESAPVGTVRQAKEALKPPAVRGRQARLQLRAKARNRRKNAAYLRQGEWFFIPVPNKQVDPKSVLTHEPIARGNRSKPHWAEFCCRSGGDTVYVCNKYPNGLLEPAYRKLFIDQPIASTWQWQIRSRDARVLVRGRISHADHKTITLDGWHEVLMNTESQAVAMRNVAFLD